MTDSASSRIVVRRTVQAPASRVFALLTDPARHPEIDGSHSLRAAVGAPQLTAVGETFVMDMHREARAAGADYRTENQVIRFKTDRRIAWTTALAGNTPSGFFWEWELQSEDELTTEVVHTYDWSQVSDPAVLARVSFPVVSAQQMQTTLDQLAALVV